MKIRNKGASPRVITAAGHPPLDVEAGGVVEVDDVLGESLLAQPDRWEEVKKSAKRGTDKES